MISDEDLMYLAGGGKLSAPDNATPRYRGEVMRLMAVLIDSPDGGCRRICRLHQSRARSQGANHGRPDRA